MHFNTLQQFRRNLYDCFEAARDALFNVNDALLTDCLAQSLIELSLASCFERKFSSVYAAFRDGRLERKRLRELFASYAPTPKPGQRLVLAVDATNIERPQSKTARDRTYLFVHNLPECSSPVTVGWQFSTLVVLPSQTSSWVYQLDNIRIESHQTPAQVAACQLREIVPLLLERPIITADRYYPSQSFLRETLSIACDLLLRSKANRVFYRRVPSRTGKRGAPKKDGPRFKCDDPTTHANPTMEWEGLDEPGHRLMVTCWTGLHLKQVRERELVLYRVIRYGATDKKGDPRISWFVWSGETLLDCEQVWQTYKLRFSIEHGYRFAKQDLLWTKAHLRTPEQFQLWTDVVGAVINQLVLAQEDEEMEAVLRPWESKERKASPQQVRRGMGRIIEKLGSPAKTPQPRGKSPGRAQGAEIKPAVRYKVVKKGPVKAKKSRKRA